MSRLAFLTTSVLWLSFVAALRADVPLYDQEPYDEVTLDAANSNEVVKIQPLKTLNRQPPPRGNPTEKLVVRTVKEPDKEYAILWKSITKVELFEQLVLNKAMELVGDKRFDEAYDYFTWLERNKSDTPGLGKAVENALYEEAKDSHRRQQYDGALALLRELHQRNPRRPGLDVALGRATDELVKRNVKAENYPAARMLLQNLAADFPEHPLVRQWRDRLIQQATPILADAQAAVNAGQWSKAGELTRRLAVLWPDLPGARELARTVHRNYPRVVVGVSALAGDAVPNRLDDWATRRTSRLLYRTLAEFAGPSTEGGKYDCPMGQFSLQGLNRRLAIKLKPNIGWADGTATLTNTDVARRLLAMADPTDPGYRVDWADLLMAASTSGVYGIEVEFRRPHVRPEAMLQIVLTPRGAATKAGEPPPLNGPFVVASRSQDDLILTGNTHYFAAQKGQPKEIVEHHFPNINAAIAALKRGDVLVLDRINPWNVPAIRGERDLVVQSYAAPLVHCLIPNLRRPLPADRNFRRALLYGIARQAILQQMLGGGEVPGCAVISGPFPQGVDASDPMGYAYDDTVEPRPYEPRLAAALSNVTLKNYCKARNIQEKKPKLPTLILAHPNDEIAIAASASIQKQLKLVDIPVELRKIDGPMPTKVPDDVDLLYVELPMWEPLVDARRILGEDGMTGGCSPFMTLALRQLDEAVDWSQVRDSLHRVHHIAFDDSAVLPLWQLIECFAYNQSLRGVAARPVSLYQGVEQWRPPFQYPAEK
jgi:ABC-type transport system substrate-binding protein